LLNKIRHKKLTENDIETLNTRFDPGFQPEDEHGYVHLTTTNKMADTRNDRELSLLPGKLWELNGKQEGKFKRERNLPAPARLYLKEGARVMFTVNDPLKRWVNGSLGVVAQIEKEEHEIAVYVELENGKTVRVNQYTWEAFEYTLDDSGSEIQTNTKGKYTQFPLMLAWAVTIHKGQGKTFDRVLVDMGYGAFAHGQMYVALSRCTTFEGIVLRRPFQERDVILDTCVSSYMANQRMGTRTASLFNTL